MIDVGVGFVEGKDGEEKREEKKERNEGKGSKQEGKVAGESAS